MNKIFKKFRVNNILTIERANSINAKGNLTKGNIPYVTRTSFNNGYNGTCGNTEKINHGNCITIGAETGIAFYQPNDFVAGNNMFVLKSEKLNKYVYLYLAGALNMLTKNYSYSYPRTQERIKKEEILLPIIQGDDGSAYIDNNSIYSAEGFVPDFEYMQERVKELEQERVKELNAYLKVTGLNDYELTEEDKKIAHTFKIKKQKAFIVENILSVEQTKSVPSKANLTEGKIPYVTRSASNNGYSGYCGNADKINSGNCITIGAETGVSFYQPNDFVAGNKVYKLTAPNLGKRQYLYLCAALNKLTKNYSYSNARIPEKIKKEKIMLPVLEDENGNPIIDSENKYHQDGYIPDWDFMEKYIRVSEKEVIADLVKKKDEIIEKTKEIVNKD